MSPFTSACIDDHCFGVDQVDDQPPQRGRVLDLLPGLLEDLAQHPRLLAEFFEDVPVVDFQFVAVQLRAGSAQPSFGGTIGLRLYGGLVCSSAIFRNSRNVICSV